MNTSSFLFAIYMILFLLHSVRAIISSAVPATVFITVTLPSDVSTRTTSLSTPILSTKFTPPPSCSSSLTKLDQSFGEIWKNAIIPVDNLTVSACYAHEFMTSYLQSIRGVSLPPFMTLSCQKDWTIAHTWSTESSHCNTKYTADTACWYIACCPSYVSMIGNRK